MAIDPTARVADGARIGASVEIGPYCIIGPQVELQRGVRLLSHVNITGVTISIREETVVYPFFLARYGSAAIGALSAAGRPSSSLARAASCAKA